MTEVIRSSDINIIGLEGELGFRKVDDNPVDKERPLWRLHLY